MPPSTVQTGASIQAGAMVDSHVLVGSGVWIGEGVAVGCGTMLGGTLMPAESLPIVLEAGCLVGGNCGLYGSVVVQAGVSIFPGTIVRSTGGLYDATKEQWIDADASGTLVVPGGSSVTMGVPPADAFAGGVQKLSAVVTRQ